MHTQITDGQLLAEFSRTRREAPFEELLRRHGALVFNTCRRVLNHSSDAEDAAQAVFVALAQKAGDRSLHARDSLSGWLYAAAWHIGVRARSALKARARHEQEAAVMHGTTDHAAQWRELEPVLDGELHALPEKYRLPILLHHFQALTVEQIATATRSSCDAVKQRLSRGREMLRERLSRRGVNVTGALLPLLLSNGATATLPFTFAATTARMAVAVAAGQAVTSGLIAQRVLDLARAGSPGISHAAKWRLAAAAVMLALLAGGVAAVHAFAPNSRAGVMRVRVEVPATGTAVAASSSVTRSDVHEMRSEGGRYQDNDETVTVLHPSPATTSTDENRDVALKTPTSQPELKKRAGGDAPGTFGPDAEIDLSKFVAATEEKEEQAKSVGTPAAPRTVPPAKTMRFVEPQTSAPPRSQAPEEPSARR